MKRYIAFMLTSLVLLMLLGCESMGKKDEFAPIARIIQENSYMSPNNDGVQDELVLNIQVTDQGFIRYWKLEIYNANGDVVRTKESHPDIENEKPAFFKKKENIDIPEKLTWDGKDESGDVVADGDYAFQFFAMDSKRNMTPKGLKVGIVNVDTGNPEVETEIKSTIFSPDGDGNKDELIIDLNLIQQQVGDETGDTILEIADMTTDAIYQGDKDREAQKWVVEILDIDEKVVRTFTYKEKGRKQLKWDGKDEEGNQLPDGVYAIRVTSTDESGNKFEDIISNIMIKTGSTPVFITTSDDKISPNEDGKFDTVDLNLDVDIKDGVEAYQVDILDFNENVVRTFKGEGEIPEVITWDGMRAFGQELADGEYSALFTVIYDNGNKPQVKSSKIILDKTPPEMSIQASPEYFSPDNDQIDDELTIELAIEDLIGVSYWRVDIMEPDNKDQVFKSFSGEGEPGSYINWNGLSDEGVPVESAEDYPVKVYSRDLAGNSSEKMVAPIKVDVLVIVQKDGRLKVRLSNIEFKPNSAEMTDSPKNKRVLDLLGKALRKYRQYTITIEGHANRYTWGLDEQLARDLSKKRAQTIAMELVKRRIPMSRMVIIGKGFDDPIIPLRKGMSKEELEARKVNRRVEFYLQKK